MHGASAETKTQKNFHKNENGSQTFGKLTWEVDRSTLVTSLEQSLYHVV